MTEKFQGDRRTFLKVAGAAAAGVWALPGWAAAAGPLGIGLVAGTFIGGPDDPAPKANSFTGRLTGSSRALAEDLLPLLDDKAGSGPGGLIIHGGGLLAKQGEGADFALDLLKSLTAPVRLTLGPQDAGRRQEIMDRFQDFGFFNGRGYYSYDHGGYRFIHLETAKGAAGAALCERAEQIAWLESELAANLAEDRERLIVLVLAASVVEGDQGLVLAAADREVIALLGRRHGQIALALCGGSASLRADWFSDTGALALTAPSPLVYPCGARTVELGVEGPVVVSKFVQTRRLDLVEASYQEARPRDLAPRRGVRLDRYPQAAPGDRMEAMELPWTRPLTPRGSGGDEVTIALVSDTHICLDKFIPPKRFDEYGLIGHFKEEGSLAILRDLLDQIVTGRHRIEFYDQVFAKDPDRPEHYLKQPVDHLLISGDLVDRGRLEEAEVFKRELEALPEPLRGRVMLAIGNHDMYHGEFVTKGPASPETPLAEFYDGLGPSNGHATYAVELADWLTLVVLNTTIPNQAGLGYNQESIDMLDDLIAANRDRAVIVASHHPIFPISIVPPLMNAYLRSSSHFTPTHAAAQDQLQQLGRKHPNLKLFISGHYHGVCCDQFKKTATAGGRPDDRFITHLQVPCTVEYPCAYRLLKVRRDGHAVTMDYVTAYTRLHELRDESRRAPIFRYLGTNPREPRGYEGAMAELAKEQNVWADLIKADPYDLGKLNVRGFKDGSANLGRGNTGKPNINGKIEVTK